jgi:ABC-type transport system substrate-binding protein
LSRVTRYFGLFCLFAVAQLLSCSHANRLDGYVYYRLASNPTTLDPALIVDVTGGTISAKLFNGLVRLDEGLQVIPDIAERWTISGDGLIYTFQLRRNVEYTNKQYVTADDIKYSFKRILDPKTRSPNTWVFEKIAGAKDYMKGKTADLAGIRVLDDHSIEIRLERPFSPFLSLLTMPPAYVVPEREVRRWGPDFSTHPVGTGPFVLGRWMPNRELRLDRRDRYFDGAARAKGIIYRVIPEDLTVVSEFELGNLDVIQVPAPEYSRYRNDPKWKELMASVKGINTYYIGMNCTRPPFNNINLRKAMSLAIDRKKLLSTFLEGRGRLAGGPVPDLLRAWTAPDPYAYDPGKAREIVSREGMDGRTIQLYITSDQEVVDMAEFIQSYIGKTGLKVRITQLEWSAYKEALNKGEADMFWLSWWADYPDPEDFLFPLFHSSNAGPAGNRTRYKNSTVDRLIEAAQTTGSEKERMASYEKAERIIVDEAPWVFFWHKTDYALRQPWIKGYRMYSIYSIDKGTQTYY